MPQLDFPTNPTLNQIYTGPEGNQWKWLGDYWRALSTSSFQSLSDYVYPYQYSGLSPVTSLTSDPSWTIRRIDFTIPGSPVIETATGAWDNRYSLIYS
jgi:hypothetical protein